MANSTILDDDSYDSESKIFRFVERSLLTPKIINLLVYLHIGFYLLLIFLLIKSSILFLVLLVPTVFINIFALNLLGFITNYGRKGESTHIKLKRKNIEFYRRSHPVKLPYYKVKVYIKNNKIKLIANHSLILYLKYYGTLEKIFPSSKEFLMNLEEKGVVIKKK